MRPGDIEGNKSDKIGGEAGSEKISNGREHGASEQELCESKVQIRRLENNPRAGEAGLVDDNIRFKRRISSTNGSQGDPTLVRDSVERKILLLPRPPVRLDVSSMGVYQSDEGSGKIFKKSGHLRGRLSGRLDSDGSYVARTSRNPRHQSGAVVRAAGPDSPSGKGSLGTNATSSGIGINNRLVRRESLRPGGEISENRDVARWNSQWGGSDGEQLGKDRRVVDSSNESISDGEVIYQGILQYPERGSFPTRLGGNMHFDGAGAGRRGVAASQPADGAGIELYSEPIGDAHVHRRIGSRVGSRDWRKASGRDVGPTVGTKTPDPRKGIVGSAESNASLFANNSRKRTDFIGGQQSYGLVFKELDWQSPQDGGHREGNLAHMLDGKHLHSRSMVDSHSRKSVRFGQPDDRFRRLGVRRIQTHSGVDARPLNHRPVRVIIQRKTAQVEQLARGARGGSSKRVLPGLAWRSELRVRTAKPDRAGIKIHRNPKCRSSGSRANLAKPTVVAADEDNGYQGARTRSRSGVLSSDTLREVRTVKSPVALRSSSSKWDKTLGDPVEMDTEELIGELDFHGFEMKKLRLAPNTRKAYERTWDRFVKVARLLKFNPEKATSEQVGWFLSYMDLMGYGMQARSMRAALSWSFESRYVKLDPANDKHVRHITEGIQREAARNHEPRKPRDPFPTRAVEQYVRKHRAETGKMDDWMWLRNATILVIGLRCMRRAGELAELQIGDIRFEKNRMMISIRHSKTDQLRKGREIIVDSTGNINSCPVAITKEYLTKRRHVQGTCPNLFLSVESETARAMSPNAISTVVKKVAEELGLKGTYSGHSLRIGGATSAISAGMTLAEVMAVGGWESGAAQRYFNTLAVAEKGGSRMMGF